MGRDAIAGLAVLAASLALFWATLGLERHPMVPVGPGFYPRIVLGVTAAMALLLVVLDVVARRRRPAAVPAGARERRNYGLVVLAFAVFGLYVIALPMLGFRLATLAFLAAMQVALETPRGARAWIAVAVLAVVATFAIHFVFEQYLQVLLPRGRWTDF